MLSNLFKKLKMSQTISFPNVLSSLKVGRNLSEQRGQALIILLLIMLVTLAVGLAITQRSITDLSQSNKDEESNRAFSAAEAGIQQANGTLVGGSINLGNESNAAFKVSPLLPQSGQPGQTGQALEYPPIGKDTVAQFWLADPNTLASYYPSSKPIDIYFGVAQTDQNGNITTSATSVDTAAIEVDMISLNSGGTDYTSTKYLIDPLSSRRSTNNFSDPASFPGSSCPATSFPLSIPINTSNSQDTSTLDRYFRCKIELTTPSTIPIMLRVRILYSNASQPIAVAPTSGFSLPPQARIYTSIGNAGVTSQKLQEFRMVNIVPQLFDFAIFSANNINKP